MLKRAAALFLSILFVFSVSLPIYSVYTLPFTDVNEGKWYFAPIVFVYKKGYMNGVSDELFDPSGTMTRAMFAVVIAKIAGKRDISYTESPFSDVETGKWYSDSIIWCAENGLVSGYETGEFKPSRPVTREQTAVLIRRLGDHLNYDVTYEDETLLSLFHDRNEISGYARPAVAWALDYGLFSGNEDFAVMPRKSATRSELAAILYRFSSYKDTPPIVPPTIYTVTFKNYDGSVLYTDNVAAGGTAKYREQTPVRPSDEMYDYSFNGWDKPITPINENTVFTAVYNETIREYIVNFINWDGTLLYSTTVKAGENAVYIGKTPEKPDDEEYTYVFSGWDKSMNCIKAETVFQAQFEAVIKPKSQRTIDPNKPMLALTFDDGPGAGSKSILDTLDNYNVAATFFDVGSNVKRYPDIIKREVEIECEIGNHTYSHPNLRNLSSASITDEVTSTNNEFIKILGYAPELMRPPYGATNPTINSIINMKIILWSIDTLDWKSRNADSVYNVAVGEAYDGAIILMHSLYPSTAAAVKRIVPALLSRGYQLVTVSELAYYKGYTMVNGERYFQFKNK